MPQVTCPRCKGAKEIQCPDCKGAGERFALNVLAMPWPVRNCLSAMQGRCSGAIYGPCSAGHPYQRTGQNLMPDQARIVLVCPRCGRSGEATISQNDNPSARHPVLTVHAISPEFRVIKQSIHWHRIMIRCTCEEVFSVIRRPKSAT
jgi:hypothetical protein